MQNKNIERFESLLLSCNRDGLEATYLLEKEG